MVFVILAAFEEDLCRAENDGFKAVCLFFAEECFLLEGSEEPTELVDVLVISLDCNERTSL